MTALKGAVALRYFGMTMRRGPGVRRNTNWLRHRLGVNSRAASGAVWACHHALAPQGSLKCTHGLEGAFDFRLVRPLPS